MKSARVVLLIVCCSLPACVSVISHDEKAAANAATEFANAAFVDRDFAKAHELMAPDLRGRIAADKLPDLIAEMHPDSFPSQVVATDFEPMPGQRGMVIYLKGQGDTVEMYYRFVMEGDGAAGYRVTGLFRGNAPYVSTNKRPLS